jgi:tyrosine-protein kinase Etk/Wzc
LKLYRKHATKRRLLITSSIGGEGKSFVSSNLAKSLASSGKKVVLIDFDMRNPKTSSLFNLTDKSGIKEFLEDEKQMEEVIQKTEHENLFVIPAGEPAINPTELLLGSRLGELFTYLESNFDYVIADTAPIQPVTDAYIISEFCDTTLFVVRHRYTPKAMIQLLDENNKIKALKNLSIVFNGIRMRGFLSKGIGYGYGYGYGYEYGYADRKYMDKTGKEG